MENKFIHAIYDDDDKLIDAVKALKSGGVYIEDVFTPVSYTHLTLPTTIAV